MRGGGLNFIHNKVKLFWNIYFGRKGRSVLSFVQLHEMLKLCIPSLLFTLTWHKICPELVKCQKETLKVSMQL